MAVSRKPRKKNPQKKAAIQVYMEKQAKDLREFLENFNQQNQHMLSYDLILRVMLNRWRILYLREDHPDIWDKYIGQYLKQEVAPLTPEERRRLLLTIYAATMTKNVYLKRYRELVTGPIEKIRGLLAICLNKDPQHIKNMKGRQLEFEGDVAQAYSDMLDVAKTMSEYFGLVDDMKKFIVDGIPRFVEYDKVLIAANQEFLKTLPTGDENKPAYKKEEDAVEDLIVEIFKAQRDDLNKELEALEEAEKAKAGSTNDAEMTQEQQDDQKEEQ